MYEYINLYIFVDIYEYKKVQVSNAKPLLVYAALRY